LGGYGKGNNVSRNDKNGNYSVYGDYPSFRYIQNVAMVKGRFINEADLDDKRKVCVIGQQVYKELFKPTEDPIGSYINIQGIYFKVIGMFRSQKRGQEALQDMSTIFTPFTTFQQAYNLGDDLHWFALTTAPGADPDSAEAKVKRVLQKQHDISPNDDRAVGAFNAQVEAKKFQGLFSGIRAFIWVVGLGTLLAGGVGISNIMLIVVTERTKEIGIRKALGASPLSIISMIVQESVFITFLAGATGMIGGVGILAVLDYFVSHAPKDGNMFFASPVVNFWVAVYATLILLVIGVLAGLMPAIKAVNINPIKALRTD
jgi:putative ABC transport system permease protein